MSSLSADHPPGDRRADPFGNPSGEIGILALQGDFQRHADTLESQGLRTREIRRVSDLEGLWGLVLPGGESTTMLRLLDMEGLYDPLRSAASSGIPVLATCGGLILLAEEVQPRQKSMGLLPIAVIRNGYGRQYHSGTFPLQSELLPPATTGVFIRAPRIVRMGDGAEVLARRDGDPVLVRKGPILGSCFHPELQESHPLTRRFAQLVHSGHSPTATLTEP